MTEKIKQALLSKKKNFVIGIVIGVVFLVGGSLILSKSELLDWIEIIGGKKVIDIEKFEKEIERMEKEGKIGILEEGKEETPVIEPQECVDPKECEERERLKAAWEVCRGLLGRLDPNEDPFEICPPYWKASELLSEGKEDEAVTLLEEVIVRFPESRHLREMLAGVFWHLFDETEEMTMLERAIKEAERALEIAHSFGSRDYVLEGFLNSYYTERFLLLGKYEEVLLLPVDTTFMHFYRGFALEKLNRLEEAKSEYSEFKKYGGGRIVLPKRFKIPGSKLQEEMKFRFEDEERRTERSQPTAISEEQAIEGLSYLIWGEAEGETLGGMRAVGWIVRNRVLRGVNRPPSCRINVNNRGFNLAQQYRSVMCQSGQFDGMCRACGGDCQAWCNDPNTRRCRNTTPTYAAAKEVYYGYAPDPVGQHCPGGIVEWGGSYCAESTRCLGYKDTYRLAGSVLNYGTTSVSCPSPHPGIGCGPDSVGKICGNGAPDNCFYPYPLYCLGSNCRTYSGSLSNGQCVITPSFYSLTSINRLYLYRGHLEGPESRFNQTDFDLYLQKWINNNWRDVAWSIRFGSVEDINYSGTRGFYRWMICSYTGSGEFKLYTLRPPSIGLPIANDPRIDSRRYCDVGPGLGQVNFSWLYEDSNGHPQSQYWLQVATDPQFNNLAVDCTSSQPVNPGQRGSATVRVTQSPRRTCQPTGEIAYNTTYYWRVKVRDSGQPPLWSEWATGTSFTTIPHPKPWPEFTWIPEIPFPADWIYFDPSSSTVYNGLSIVDWVFSGDPLYPRITTTTLGIVLNAYRTEGSKDVTLTITDTSGYSCSLIQTIGIEQQVLPNPRRYEPRE
jgi:tetratricopeptide (TPR) repeat protein